VNMFRQDEKPIPIAEMVFASLFAALIAVGAYISVPIPGSPVPIVLQNLFVLLAGLTLGWRWSAAAVGLYLFVGLLGLPVFSGGSGGIAHFLGPTGGYLVGFLVAAPLTGLIANGNRRDPLHDNGTVRGTRRSLLRDIVAVVAGTAAVYAVGIPWLKAVTALSWTRAAAAGLIPFIAGDLLKAAAAVAALRLLSPAFRYAFGGRYAAEPPESTENRAG